MVKHAPKFYVRLCTKQAETVGNFTVYSGSIYGRFSENGLPVFWVCDNYTLVRGNLPVHICRNGEWKLMYVSPEHPCFLWVKTALSELGKVPVIDRENLCCSQVASMMNHDRRHKKGTGARINTHQINQPLKWNEVTELAHWHGKGNASVVASNFRR